jgi:levansucrase
MTTSDWSPAAVAAIAAAPLPEAPLIHRAAPLLPGFDLWDFWPVQEEDGRVAQIGGGTLYFFLAAPAGGDPEERHGRSSLRVLHQGPEGWRDLGPAFPGGFAPGSRQWSGSTIVDSGNRRLTLYFTAAGRRGEARLGFEQRLFVTSAALTGVPDAMIGEWTVPVEIVAPGGCYMQDMSGGGGIGTIKAFRDPCFFRDPADGADYLLFTASLAGSPSAWNGVVGVARRDGQIWSLQPPLISADGVNNELERPHVVAHDGRYYCFWSTQGKVFAAGGPAGPTGLYGMVADRFAGPWRPLNGSGLVVANPAAAPHQAYSWLVLDDRRVLSFVDLAGLPGVPGDAATARRHFGGTPAPELRLHLDGARTALA